MRFVSVKKRLLQSSVNLSNIVSVLWMGADQISLLYFSSPFDAGLATMAGLMLESWARSSSLSLSLFTCSIGV